MEFDKDYIIGIDLGTSNCALTYLKGDSREDLNTLSIPQLESPGLVKKQTTLPSAVYIPHENEAELSDLKLPWEEEGNPTHSLGYWARSKGSLSPTRLITSAKSWLCNPHIDRTKPVLPWQSDVEKGQLSPLEVSKLLLSHLSAALCHQEDISLGSKSEVVLTVPASFDEVARRLTYQAAKDANLGEVILLEEPQAAFYAWISANESSWREKVAPGDVVLVCDVGGGTTDFSLIAVTEVDGSLELERISVGNHLLLGGDNMDLALAYTIKANLEQQGQKIDNWQMLSLIHSTREAKEVLLSNPHTESIPISIASRGSSLFAKTISAHLDRPMLERVLLDGFFPESSIDDLPKKARLSGLQEFGLDYETDAGITKHLAQFLKNSLENVLSQESLKEKLSSQLDSENGCIMPTAVLFNGGVFKSPFLRERVQTILQKWNGGNELKVLSSDQLDLACSVGASYYGKIRNEGKGLRIRSGTAHSYYLGIEGSMPAVPGITPPINGLCVVPQGTEEGTNIELKNKPFGLVTGEPTCFRFFSSNTRAGDSVGELITDADSNLIESSELTLTVPPLEEGKKEVIPVTFDARVTEVGTLQLSMCHTQSDKRWDLEFNVRLEY